MYYQEDVNNVSEEIIRAFEETFQYMTTDELHCFSEGARNIIDFIDNNSQNNSFIIIGPLQNIFLMPVLNNINTIIEFIPHDIISLQQFSPEHQLSFISNLFNPQSTDQLSPDDEQLPMEDHDSQTN